VVDYQGFSGRFRLAQRLKQGERSRANPSWGAAPISIRTGGGHNEAAFLRHLMICQGWAQNIENEGKRVGLEPSEIGPYLNRPTSSVAKLIDEWLYATITGGF